MALITCKECGKEYSSNAKTCPKCGNPNEMIDNNVTAVIIKSHEKGTWSIAKLVISIISLLLFLLIALQSCAAGISNILSNNDSYSGTAGLGCALFILVAGIVTLVTRNMKGKGGSIASTILYWFAALLTLGSGKTYPDLPIWGSIAFSFGIINFASIFASIPKEKNTKTALNVALTIGVIIISFIGLIIGFVLGSVGQDDKDKEKSKTKTSVKESKKDNNSISSEEDKQNLDQSDKDEKDNFSLGETFEFDNLEISLGTNYTFTKVKNGFSDKNGKSVIKIPITVKNIGEETHGLNNFYCKSFGSQGIELDEVWYYFSNSIDEAGELKPGASYTKYYYVLYDGNGDYAIEFDDWVNKITVEFNINK